MSFEEKRVQSLSENLAVALARLSHNVTPKYVHRLRTAIRRIESLIDYARPVLGRKQEKALKNLFALRKRAGKVRDLDVQMRLLGAIANTSTANDRHALADSLKRKRSRQAERLGTAVAKVQGSSLPAHLEHILEKVGEFPSSPELTAAPLTKARGEMKELAEEYAVNPSTKPRALHKVRIKIKKIRYLAELAEPAPEQERFLAGLKTAQDALGDWHDWEQLTQSAEEQFGDRINCPLLVEVHALFAAKQAGASGAVSHLLAAHAELPGRKRPRGVDVPRPAAQRA